jgi:hypothetical protein
MQARAEFEHHQRGAWSADARPKSYLAPCCKAGGDIKMLTLYTGLYGNLSAAQQRAIFKLTMRRYVEAIHLPEYLEHTQGLTPGTSDYEAVYASFLDAIRETLSGFDRRTYVSAILLSNEADEWIALASMRSLRGQRAAVPVSRSIGCADSSIPTHVLLQSFQYPHLPDFDPDVVTEAEIFEASRLVTGDRALIEQVVSSRAMSEAEIQAVLASAFDELIVSAARNAHALTQMAGWIFNVKPKLAASVKLRKGLNLISLYSQGVEPTAQALSTALDKPYFQRWHTELFKLIPAEIVQQGVLAAVRYMASRDIREWHNCEVSLPYLVVNNAEFESAVQKLEAKVAQRSYELAREMAYA